jgi:two-component system cell cycle sensor histidine kinase/response regulator CckA
MSVAVLAGAVVLCAVVATLRCSRQRADAAQRLQAAALSSIGDAVIATDANGLVTFLNPEAERLTGWLATDANGRPLTDVFHVIHEETNLTAENPAAIVLRTGEAQALSNHTVLISRIGNRVPIENKASPIRNADRLLQGVVLVFRDCTKCRHLEATIHDRLLLQEQLSQIASTAPGVICAYRVRPDGSTMYPYASPGIRDIYGVTPEELGVDASSIFKVIHPDDIRWVIESTNESARRLEAWQGEFRVNHPVKGLIWVEGRSFPEREPDGSVLWRGFLNDISKRKRAEEALHLSEERFREIAENIREVFWLTDPAKGEIAYVSPAYESIWGRPTSSLYASPRQWMEAIHPDDRDRIVHASVTKQRTGDYDEEYRIVRPDGRIRWIRDRGFPVRDTEGAIIRIAGVAEDITERRELEAELRQAQKMESIGLLAGGVAHDFNNVLTVIMGSTEALAETMPANTEAAAALDEIRTATSRAASLTRQLLAFSRKDVIAPRVIDFNALVSDTERMLRRLLGEDIELTASLDTSIGRVRVDPGQWNQVLVNLAVNARDAMTGCGRLAITTRDVRIGAEAADPLRIQPGRYAEVSISDTGSGMPDHIMARIFDPFFTTKGVGHGTGLGLAVVYGIVRQAGGHIDVRSTEHVGTTFTILIPTSDATVEPASDRQAAAAGASETGTETILLVEDEDGLRRMAARALTKHGYTVLQASSGPDALRLLEAHDDRIDLLVTDVVMPSMDGRELADKVRQCRPSTRVLFTSGYTEEAVVHRGVEAASVAFLQKPYVPLVLARKVREVLQQGVEAAA